MVVRILCSLFDAKGHHSCRSSSACLLTWRKAFRCLLLGLGWLLKFPAMNIQIAPTPFSRAKQARSHLHERPNQPLQPTAGRSDE